MKPLPCHSSFALFSRKRGPKTKTSLLAALLFLSGILFASAVEPVDLKVPHPEALVGQRLSFYVDLRSPGPFAGAASFSLPKIPGTVIVKVGDPVVSNAQLEGDNWFVQTHEFALFSQRSGSVSIPEIPVRFGSKKDFTSAASDVEAVVPGFDVKIERPSGAGPEGFLVTTKELTIKESWNPQPEGEVRTGAVFKRTITQSADDLTGMALDPAPVQAPSGVRVYAGKALVTDNTERGALSGQRTETLTYLVEKPGNYTLPEIRYAWWNPATGRLESQTLPGVQFTAKAPPGVKMQRAWNSHPLTIIAGLLGLGALCAALWHKRDALETRRIRLYEWIDPLENRLARAFVRACRRNEPRSAGHSWENWIRIHPQLHLPPALQEQLLRLRRFEYGTAVASESWDGGPLADAFLETLKTHPGGHTPSGLPSMNP